MLSGIDPLAKEHDLGKSIQAGSNTLKVEVATTLLNRLRVTNSEVFGKAKRQDYGLLGPIEIRPYYFSALT
jgi:hypothetical protein